MGEKCIRVFARRTKLTPTDDLAFYDEPPLFELPDVPVYVSVTFTWDMQRGWALHEAWRRRCRRVLIGGPAFGDMALRGFAFTSGRFLRSGVTITSRGCPNRCPWCVVPHTEGKLMELRQIAPGHIVQDNNLLACSRSHVEHVFDMLAQQPKAAVFAGGLEARRLQPWHIEWWKSKVFRLKEAWFAADSPSAINTLDRVAELMADFRLRQKRCYILAGWASDDTPTAAERRCEAVLKKGFCPFLMLYQPAQGRTYSTAWKEVQRKWARPAAYLSTGKKSQSHEARITGHVIG